MSEPDRTPGGDQLADLPRLPRDEGGPVFAEPWQAQAFALAVNLSDQGWFTWKEWAAALADELKVAAGRGEPDDGSRYYEHWLAALERLVTAKGLADPTALLTRKEEWAAAYRNTPHGQPVELRQTRAAETSWLLLGLACTFATYWMLQQASVGPMGEPGLWTRSAPDGSSALPLGFAASAGLGTLLGMRHALEPDHLAAVSTLMTGERSSAKAAWLGAFWGLGHTLTLFTAGALLVVLQTEMPAIAARVLEVCVVLLLVGFGVRAILSGRPPGASGSDAFPSKTRSILTLSNGPMDTRTTTRSGRCPRTGGQRRDDCARSDDAPVNGDAVGLFDAVWCGIDRGDGCALRSIGVAPCTFGIASPLHARRFPRGRLCLDRARLVLGLSLHRRLALG